MKKIKWILILIIIVAIVVTGIFLFLNHKSDNNNIEKNDDKKYDYTINYNKHIQLAEITSYDAGEYNKKEERKTGTYYLLYTDGNLLTYDKYTNDVIKNKEYSRISEADVKKINDLLKESIDTPDDFSSAVDGVEWKFTYYNENEDIIGEYNGYIYDNENFNDIIDILDNNKE